MDDFSDTNNAALCGIFNLERRHVASEVFKGVRNIVGNFRQCLYVFERYRKSPEVVETFNGNPGHAETKSSRI